MNIISIISKPELGDIPIMYIAAYMAQVHQIISELYHTVESVEEREIIKNELAKMAQIC